MASINQEEAEENPSREESKQRDAPPSPYEESDFSEESKNPWALEQVLADIDRLSQELGPTHTKIAETWNSLGLIRLHVQNMVSAAIKCHEEALYIYRSNSDECSLAIAATLNDLGLCYERIEDQARALSAYEEAERILQSDDSTGSSSRCLLFSVQKAIARIRRL